jgi:hypothetical protein
MGVIKPRKFSTAGPTGGLVGTARRMSAQARGANNAAVHAFIETGGSQPGSAGAASGLAWDAGLLNNVPLLDTSVGAGYANWDPDTGALTLFGSGTANRGIAQFLVEGMALVPHRLTFTIVEDPAGSQNMIAAVDVNSALGFSESSIGPFSESGNPGDKTFDFTPGGANRYIQFYTGSPTGEIELTNVRLVQL